MAGFELLDASLLSAMFIALLAGVLSFASPCVLPIVPPYLAYIGGVSFTNLKQADHDKGTVVLSAVCFVLGLSVVFIFLGFTASLVGTFFLQNQILFGRIAGIVIILFGLHFLGLFRIPILDRELRFGTARGNGVRGAFVLGLAFAFGWVPCIGPQLGAILSLAAQESSIAKGTLLLAVYAAGLGIPFILVAMFFQRSLGFMERMRAHMPLIEKCIGGLLICVGTLMATNQFSIIAFWLLETFPALAVLG
ncbi:MAG: cytochrome c biogenesis protein CcdA [Rhodobacteraceae bacterium]|nr:cytochrome c biogenesis protein CcdA [Paracoccaceae bacterium]